MRCCRGDNTSASTMGGSIRTHGAPLSGVVTFVLRVVQSQKSYASGVARSWESQLRQR